MSFERKAFSHSRSRKPSQKFFETIGYTPYPFQKEIHDCPALYRIAIIGRQSGKSALASVEAAFEICCVPESSGWVVAPTYDQASIIFKRTVAYVEKAVRKLKHLKITTYSRRDLILEVSHFDPKTGELRGISRFAGKSGDKPDNLRGASLTYVIMDEAAMTDEMVWFEALNPTLSTTGGWVLMITTPKGYNWVYQWFQHGQDLSQMRYRSWQIASWVANPEVPLEFYEEQQRKMPDLTYRQEYGAEFISDAGSVFIGVQDCPKEKPISLQMIPGGTSLVFSHREAGHAYAIGADFARLNDFSVFTVVDIHTRQVVRVDRLNTVAWTSQLARLRQISQDYGGAMVVPDITGLGDPVVEQIAAMGVPVNPVKFSTLNIKEALISKLALSIQFKNITLPDDEEYLKEFTSFIYTRTEGGQLKMAAAGGSHDDRVISLALAWMLVPAENLGMNKSMPQQKNYFDQFEINMDAVNSLLD